MPIVMKMVVTCSNHHRRSLSQTYPMPKQSQSVGVQKLPYQTEEEKASLKSLLLFWLLMHIFSCISEGMGEDPRALLLH